MRKLIPVAMASVLFGCAGGTAPGAHTQADAGTAPATTASPAGETFVGTALSVLLTSVPAATITYTVDGSDPTTSQTAQSGPSPVVVTLTSPAKVQLTFYAHDAAGAEKPHSERYTLLAPLSPASISGRLIVPDSLVSGQPVLNGVVALYAQDPSVTPTPSPIQVVNVSPKPPANGQYVFQGLAAGTYWIAGALGLGPATGNPSAFGTAVRNPITLDPASSTSSRADFVDVYIGECDPSGTGIDGVVEVAPQLQADSVMVVGLDAPISAGSSASNAVGYAGAIGDGAERPFGMCGVPAAPLYVLAEAAATGSQSPAAISEYPGNPVDPTHVVHAKIYLGEQDPTLGSIGGTVKLSGPLTGGTVSVLASTTAWIPTPNVVAAADATMTDATDYAYALQNLQPGTYYLLVQAKTADGISAYFPGPTAVTVTGTQAATSDLTASVGRIDGTVGISNVPSGAGKTLVLASPVGETTPKATDTITLGAPDPSGVESGTFTLFGLPDGTYTVAAVVDVLNNGNFAQDAQAGHVGVASTPVVIAGGSTASENFAFTLN